MIQATNIGAGRIPVQADDNSLNSNVVVVFWR